VQQVLTIPSGVKGMHLQFDVQASSWDRWGGDYLEVDLVDSGSGQSVLVTPVRWNNRQLATGDWLPLDIQITDWPGIDTPVSLVFRGVTDWAFPTDFTLDNIKLTTLCQ
jgi:hypothetical protein